MIVRVRRPETGRDALTITIWGSDAGSGVEKEGRLAHRIGWG